MGKLRPNPLPPSLREVEQRLTSPVIPAKAGIHFELKIFTKKQSQKPMDSRLREDDRVKKMEALLKKPTMLAFIGA